MYKNKWTILIVLLTKACPLDSDSFTVITAAVLEIY